MKKFLVRGGADPLVSYSPADVLTRNYIGGNSGNMLFLYGVINALTTEQTQCVITNRKSRWSDADIARINEEYAAVIFPLADAFRADYRETLRDYTAFIRKLKIPCIVIGVGLRAELEPQLDISRPFDEEVRQFVKAVLAHSAKLGLRGETTGRYLEKLGFAKDRDFTVIGCPSLYMHGTAIARREPDFEKTGVNLNAIASDAVNGFYTHLLQTDAHLHIFQQRRVEFIDWYYGKRVDLSTFVPEYPPRDIFAEFDFERMKQEDRVHFFLDVPSWLAYMESFGFFVGCRFHGVVAAILAGVPAAMTPIDSRTSEFTRFHEIPTLRQQDVEGKKSLYDCAAGLDFSAFYRRHRENTDNYLAFLAANALPSAFEQGTALPFGSSVLEKKLAQSASPRVYPGYAACGAGEKLRRQAEYRLIEAKARLRKRHI